MRSWAQARLAAGSVALVRLHRQRGWRLMIETVTLVMRFFFTSILHRKAMWPAPSMSVKSFSVPTFWRSTALPLRSGSSFTASR